MKQKYLKVMFNTTSRTSSNFKYKIDTEKKSNKTHYEIGKKIRKAIADRRFALLCFIMELTT